MPGVWSSIGTISWVLFLPPSCLATVEPIQSSWGWVTWLTDFAGAAGAALAVPGSATAADSTTTRAPAAATIARRAPWALRRGRFPCEEHGGLQGVGDGAT